MTGSGEAWRRGGLTTEGTIECLASRAACWGPAYRGPNVLKNAGGPDHGKHLVRAGPRHLSAAGGHRKLVHQNLS
ncbi:hypothetical protein J6590_066814 [Homalodisca vitripennis]|nr:hypothetical protein J6590_066814 [Homalodisca vitripennis]